jgi:2-polyprenyl-3-methyl-5-hydroxy-6-metoxy-1,4-benzoquinol methylase
MKGIGMSEWDVYARILQHKFYFINTYYHQEPRLDITSDDWQRYSDLDFVICTEVFEHILQPLEVGFRNMRQMLKKNGVLVFSAPFTGAPQTTEHFPGMTNFVTCQVGDRWLVVSRKADGGYDVYGKRCS